MGIYESAAKAIAFEPKPDSAVRIVPTEIDADGEGEYLTAYLVFPNGDRGEIELFFTHDPVGPQESHWDRLAPRACPKLNGEYIDFDDWLAAFSGSSDSEAGNIKLDNILREHIYESFDRWADEMNRRAAEDAWDQKEKNRQFFWQKEIV